ncbi:MAG TPA: SdrD B-like domain-containing protein [Pseudonocardiaceae bacterium]|nr:SdrD B-like domain-containing protein [Pseudonocardiaceae bacterium]
MSAVCLAGGFVLAAPTFAASAPSSSCVIDPPAAGVPAAVQELRVCVSFDKTAYRSSDTIRLTASVTNLGTATAQDVTLQMPTDDGAFQPTGGYLSLFGYPGGIVQDIPAGATVRNTMPGFATDPALGTVTFDTSVSQDGYVESPSVGASATVTPVFASYGGTAFIDSNYNGVQDPGETGLAGVRITLSGPFNGIAGVGQQHQFTETTDAQGHFRFDDIPAGPYVEGIQSPDGWVVSNPDIHGGYVTVDGSPGQQNVSYPATPPLSDRLHASFTMDQPSYRVGQSAHVTLTLDNVGAQTISGIQASCDNEGFPFDALGVGKGWNVFSGAGVSVAAGQQKVFHLSEVVPSDALLGGNFTVECTFGPSDLGGYPDAQASANVTASLDPTVDFAVRLVDDGDQGVPGGGATPQSPRIMLVDAANGDPITSYQEMVDVADYTGIPVGRYRVVVSNGWQIAPGRSSVVTVTTATSGAQLDVHVVPTFH